jgi:hypothetical protein
MNWLHRVEWDVKVAMHSKRVRTRQDVAVGHLNILLRHAYETEYNHENPHSEQPVCQSRYLLNIIFLASHYVPSSMTMNGNQFNTKFLHLEADRSDMQLRYHQLCSLASNIPSELRVAPRSTPDWTFHFCWQMAALYFRRLLHRWHCVVDESILVVRDSVGRCHYLFCLHPSHDSDDNPSPK